MRRLVLAIVGAMTITCSTKPPPSAEPPAAATPGPVTSSAARPASSASAPTASGAAPSPAGEAPSSAPAGPSMSHRTKHGGILGMAVVNGVHVHVEAVVRPEGRVSLWATDAHGAAVGPETVTGNVICERADTHAKTTVAVRANAGTGAVEATCPALVAPSTNVTYDLVVRGTPVMNTLHVPRGGTSATAADHGASPRDAGAMNPADHSHHDHEH